MIDALAGALLAATAATCWGAGALLARTGMRCHGAAVGALVSVLSGLVLVGAVALVVDARAVLAVRTEALWQFLLLGFLQFPVARLLSYRGIRLIGAPSASAIVAANPLFAALLAVTILGESLTILTAIGILGIVLGLMLVVTQGRPRAVLTGVHGGTRILLMGVGAALGAAIGYALTHTVARNLLTDGVPPQVGAVYTLFFGALLLMSTGARRLKPAWDLDRRGMGHLALAGLCSAGGVLALYSALSRAPVVLVNPIAAMTPVVVMVGARLLPGETEPLAGPTVAGALIVLVFGGLLVSGAG